MTSSKLSELKELAEIVKNNGSILVNVPVCDFLKIIECLESATELLQEQIDFGYDQTNHLADGLAEIESKLGGLNNG